MCFDKALFARFLAKFALDVLPAALASLIGGFLVTHYGLGRPVEQAALAAPASAEMMELVRDEHGLILNFLNAQLANEKRRLAAEDAAWHRNAASELAAGKAAARQTPVATIGAKAGTEPPARSGTTPRIAAKSTRSKGPGTGAALAPLVTMAAPPSNNVASATREPGPFIATVDLKDHVVAVTHRVVSAIGGITSWFGSFGDRIGGERSKPRTPADLVNS